MPNSEEFDHYAAILPKVFIEGSKETKLADWIFACQQIESMTGTMFLEACCQIFEMEDPPFDDWTFDWYDRSFELKQCQDGFIITKAQQAQFSALGFDRAWLCYVEGPEQYYLFG